MDAADPGEMVLGLLLDTSPTRARGRDDVSAWAAEDGAHMA